MNKNITILKRAFSGAMSDRIVSQSAALSYYTLFSIAPLVLIAVAVSGLFFGQEASRGEIFSSISGLVGPEGAQSIQSFVEASAVKSAGIMATIIGVVTLILGATSTFAQLQDSLNEIWRAKPKTGNGVWLTVRQRLLSFSLILIIGFLLLVSLLVSAALSGVEKYVSGHLPGGAVLWQVVNFGISFGVTYVLFAAIFKILPDVDLKWKDVWSGSLVTTFLFSIGRFLIGVYLGKSGLSSTYGAAGSVMIILVWTYYSSMVLLFGAEITRFYSLRNESVIPDDRERVAASV